MPESKQSVNLPLELVSRIQSAFIAKRGTARGAVQEVLRRGAELALAELIGDASKAEDSIAPSGKPLYNFPNIATVKQKITESKEKLVSIIQDLDQALLSVGQQETGPHDSSNSPRDSAKAKRNMSRLEQNFRDVAPQIEADAQSIRESLDGSQRRKRPHAG